MLPHFDFHFFMISTQLQNNISGTGSDSAAMYLRPENRYVPTDYSKLAGSGKALFGVTYYDTTSPEFHGKLFTKTLHYGFYNGMMISIDPAVTTAFFLSKESYTGTVKQPQAYPKTGYYPDDYNIKYDAANGEYIVSLINLTSQ